MKTIIPSLLLLIAFTAGCAGDQLKDENTKLKAELARSQQREADLERKVREEEERYKRDCKTLSDGLNNEMDNGQITMRKVKSGVAVNMADRLFFENGKADITKPGKELLNRVAVNLRKLQDKVIRIDGHTDNARIRENSDLHRVYPTNWELGAARAVNVVRYLTEKCGVNPSVVSASSYSFYQPADTNNTRDGRAKNRRIEIMVLDRDVVDLTKPVYK